MKILITFLLFVTVTIGSQSETIIVENDPLRWTLQTEHSVYQMAVASDGIVIPVFYGPSGDSFALSGAPVRVNPKQGSDIREVPYRGGFVNQIPALEVIYFDHTRDAHLVYQSHTIMVDQDQYSTLRLHLLDVQYGLRVTQCYRVLPELDLIQKWMEVKNASEQVILIENAQSGSIWLSPADYELLHLSGSWGEECMLQSNRLTPGIQTMQVRDFRDYNNPPWFALTEAGTADETSGNVWFGVMEWSGNWRIDFEKQAKGAVQVIGGINFWDTHWNLNPGETFTAPVFTFGFTRDGLGGASRRLHDYARRHVMRTQVKVQLLPVLYNSWYATTFHIDEDQQIALAQKAHELGVELFVIDDGWFHGRKNDHAGLGDWWVDREKFPNGLTSLIQRVNDIGMDFGIWVEPEMVNPDSELYRNHPEWVLHYPKRIQHESRNQLMLNLAREDVYAYLLESLTKLLRENNIRFIKWDYNRSLSDAGWSEMDPVMQREVRIRYIYNFHRLVRALQEQFPQVIFECCSGGGGRLNMDNLKIMDQFWTSDNTDPFDRVMIQYGYLYAFPAKTMVSWITHEDWHKRNPSLKYRFHVSMCGVLGIGDDITKWDQAQMQESAEYVKIYKEIRPLVQHGDVHRILSPFDTKRSALQYVNASGSESVVFQFNLWETLPGTSSRSDYQPLRLHGLKPESQYRIFGDYGKNEISGATLMNIGLPWVAKGNSASALIRIEEIAGEDSIK